MSSNNAAASTTTTTTTLLLIDVQKDFHPGGSLAIPTAHEDAQRIAQLIRQSIVFGGGANGTNNSSSSSSTIHRIIATLDTHQKLHIAHGCFWHNSKGDEHPPPFTIISSHDIENGVWKPRFPDLVLPEDSCMIDPSVFADIEKVLKDDGSKTLDLQKYALEYTRRLEQQAGNRRRFQLCIWPEHCLIGTTGHAVVDDVQQALQEWSDATGRSVEWLLKGQHLLTEMYSALQADVPVSRDTAFNTKLLNSLLGDDLGSSNNNKNNKHRLLVCGQAKSHCVNYTVRDLISRWPPERIGEICLLQDCASPVPGFEDAALQFEADISAAGVCLVPHAADVFAFSDASSSS
jgi:nicotinamidase/pyrazinamidase